MRKTKIDAIIGFGNANGDSLSSELRKRQLTNRLYKIMREYDDLDECQISIAASEAATGANNDLTRKRLSRG